MKAKAASSHIEFGVAYTEAYIFFRIGGSPKKKKTTEVEIDYESKIGW